MGTGIIVCGCNGSGKSTLGRALAEKLHYSFIDIEDCFFPKEDTGYVYDNPRSREEAESILLSEVNGCDHFVFASVKGNYGKEIMVLYQCAVLISVPKGIRLQRIKNRSYKKFGDRILPGADLYEREKQFLDMAASRTERDIEEWLDTINCPVIRVDGTKVVEENVEQIKKKLFTWQLLTIRLC